MIFVYVHHKEVYCIGFLSLCTLDDDGRSKGEWTKLMACSLSFFFFHSTRTSQKIKYRQKFTVT